MRVDLSFKISLHFFRKLDNLRILSSLVIDDTVRNLTQLVFLLSCDNLGSLVHLTHSKGYGIEIGWGQLDF